MSKDKTTVEESTVYESHMDAKADKAPTLATLIGEEEPQEEWEKHWGGMPEYEQENNQPWKKLIVSFATREDYMDFQEKIGQNMTEKTKSIWHPHPERLPNKVLRWVEDD